MKKTNVYTNNEMVKKFTKVLVNMLTVFILTIFVYVFLDINKAHAINIPTRTSTTNLETIRYKYPDMYQKLKDLKRRHPSWTFSLYRTGLDWNNFINVQYNERNRTNPKSLIESKNFTRRGLEWVCPSRKNLSFDGKIQTGRWKAASKEAISYYVDPRTYMDDSKIFALLNTGEQNVLTEKQITDGVNKILAGTKNARFPNSVKLAAKNEKIHPFYLATRLRQEGGLRGFLPGDKQEYFNPLNVGATGKGDQEIIKNGLTYAKRNGWTTFYDGLRGGAKLMSSYQKRGQNTKYAEKFDYINNGALQYMQNIEAPYHEQASMKTAFQMGDSRLTNPYNFVIPIYDNMPINASPVPTKVGMKTLHGVSLYPGESVAQAVYSIKIRTNYNEQSTILGEVPRGNKVAVTKTGLVNGKDKYIWASVRYGNVEGYMVMHNKSNKNDWLKILGTNTEKTTPPPTVEKPKEEPVVVKPEPKPVPKISHVHTYSVVGGGNVKPEIEFNLYRNGVLLQKDKRKTKQTGNVEWLGLDKYDSKEIDYKYESKVNRSSIPSNYELTIDQNGKTEIRYIPQNQNLNINVNWDGGQTVKPKSQVVNVLRDGRIYKEITLTEANNWTYTLKNIPKEDINKKQYVYTITPKENINNFETSVNGTTITNKYIVRERTETVNAYWIGGKQRPEIILNVKSGNNVIKEIKLNENNNFKGKYNVNATNKDGSIAKYNLELKNEVPGYNITIEGNTVKAEYIIPKTNKTFNIEFMGGKSLWKDLNISLVTNNTKTENTKTITRKEIIENNGKIEIEFKDLNKTNKSGEEIKYNINIENDLEKFAKETDSETGNIIFKYNPDLINITTSITWKGGSLLLIKPNFQIVLKQDGKVVEKQNLPYGKEKVVFKSKLKYKENEETDTLETVKYTVEILNSRGYKIINNTPFNEEPADKNNLKTNAKQLSKLQSLSRPALSQTLNDTEPKTANEVNKISDEVSTKNFDLTIQYEIPKIKLILNTEVIGGTLANKEELEYIVNVLRDGKIVEEFAKTGNLQTTELVWEDLPQTDTDGREYKYEINIDKESIKGRYILDEITENEVTKTVFKYIPETYDKDIQVNWINGENAIPEIIVLELIQNDKVVSEINLKAIENWKYKITDIPKTDIDGNVYEYTLRLKDEVKNFNINIENTDIVKITGEYQIPKTNIIGNVLWDGGKIKKDVVVILTLDEKEIDRKKTVDGKVEFEVNKTDINGNEYKYIINQEEDFENYITQTAGYNITNIYISPKTTEYVKLLQNVKDNEKVNIEVIPYVIENRKEKTFEELKQIVPSNTTGIQTLVFDGLDLNDKNGNKYNYAYNIRIKDKIKGKKYNVETIDGVVTITAEDIPEQIQKPEKVTENITKIPDEKEAGTNNNIVVNKPSLIQTATGDEALKDNNILDNRKPVSNVRVKRTASRNNFTKYVQPEKTGKTFKIVQKNVSQDAKPLDVILVKISPTGEEENLETIQIKPTQKKLKLPNLDTNGYKYILKPIDNTANYKLDFNEEDDVLKIEYDPLTKDITARVIWKGLTGDAPILKLQLYANGQKQGETVIVESGQLGYTFKDLQIYDEDGNEIEYKVEQVNKLDDYETTKQGDFTIINANKNDMAAENTNIEEKTNKTPMILITVAAITAIGLFAIPKYFTKSKVNTKTRFYE